MPFIIPALIGAGASLIGSAASAISNSKTNRTNFEINQLNNEFNERMMQKQMDYNTMMWEKENAYNDPAEQRARLEKAGFNPYMMMSNVTTGNAQGAGSTSAASAAPAAPQQAMQYNMQGIADAILMAKQGANLDAEREQQLIDNQTRMMRNMSEIGNTIARTQNEKIQNKLLRTQYSYADQLHQVQIANQEAQTAKILRETVLLNKELSIFDERTRLDFAQRSANIMLTNAQRGLTKQQTVHEIQKMYETVARQNGLKISNDVAKRSANAIVDKIYNEEYWSRSAPNLQQAFSDWLRRQ